MTTFKEGRWKSFSASEDSSTTTPVARTVVGIDPGHKEILLPLIIKGERVCALLDTGCNRSFINPELVKKLNIKSTPDSTPVGLAAHDLVGENLGLTEPVEVQYGTRTVHIRFVIMRLGEISSFIGMLDLSALGIGISGLNTDFPDINRRKEPEPILRPEIVEDNPAFSPEEEVEFYKIIQPFIDANQAMPASRYCELPEPEVDIITEPGVTSWIAQYKVPERAKPAITKRVEEWLSLGIIEYGETNVKFNSPIMAVLKGEKDI